MNGRRRAEYVHDPVFGRKLALAYKYGMTPADYDAMVLAQGNACAICQIQMVKPCIDHNHETGKVRGLLCHGCNIKLAAIEQVDYRTAALAYLERYK